MWSSSLQPSIEIKPLFVIFVPLGLWGRSHPLVILHLGGHCSKVGMHTHTRVCQACCCLLCQVKSRHYNTCMHVFVRAVEPVKCGTVILLQQIMSADSARQCEQWREAVAAGLHCCLLCQVKSQGTTHLHARVCACSGTCQMWDRNSATTDNVCRQCKTMRAEERGCRCWFALLPPLSGEKSRHYTLACTCLCAQWNLSNVGP